MTSKIDERSAAIDTIAYLQDQGVVPMSPGETSETGRVTLCTAAALVRCAIARSHSEGAAEKFESKVTAMTSEWIIDVGEGIGMNRDLVAAALGYNDSLPPPRRLEGATGLLGAVARA